MRRGGAAAGNNAAYPAAPPAGRKGQARPFLLGCFPRSPFNPNSTATELALASSGLPETRKPPPSTLLLAPEDQRGAGRATTEDDGNCCREKMSLGVLMERSGRRHGRY